MANTSPATPAPAKRRGWLRFIGWALGIVLVLLVVVYFVATSSAFVKGVILPRVGASMNAKVTVGDASISPFSQVLLRDFKVQTTGTEPLVSASEVRLRYSLMAMMRGNILVHEVTVASPTITLIENADGSSNLDPILKAQAQQPAEPAPPAPPSAQPMQIDVKRITLSNGTIRQIKNYGGDKRDVAELSNLNIDISDLKNGQTGKLSFSSDIKMQNTPPAPGTNGTLQATLKGNFSLGLTPDLKPGSIQGNTRLDVTRAEGAFAEATGLGLSFDCGVEPTEVKQIALALQKGGTRLAQVLVTGPFDMAKCEGRLAVQLLDVDKNLFNLAGAAAGLDFGPTTLSSTNLITLAKGGQSIGAAGRFNLNSFQVTQAGQTTPPMDLGANYDVVVDRAASNILLRVFGLTGTQRGNQFLKGDLSNPMTISMGPGAAPGADSALNVVVSHFDLANWKAFLGDVAPSGEVNAKLQLLSKQAGKQLGFDLNSEIANLTAGMGSNQVSGLTITLRLRGQGDDQKQYSLPECKFEVSRQNQPILTASAAGSCDQTHKAAELRLDGELNLPRLVSLLPGPDAAVSSGTAKLNARVLQNQQLQTVTGSFVLAGLTGRFGSNSFRDFGTTAEFDVVVNQREAQLRKLAGKISEGAAPGGAFDLTATCNLTNGATTLNAKLVDFNQAGLRAFLEPALSGKKLVSIALNGNAAAQYDPAGASSVKAGLQVANLVVNDPTGQIPAKPLEARVDLDASLNKQVAEIKQFALGLTPTDRATNRVQLTGRVDMSDTNNISGNLKLAADSLDLTTYYDLFAGQGASSPAKPAPSPAPPAPDKEPEPMVLPVTNFVAEAAVGRLYLHEVAISNAQTVVTINGGRILIDPCKLNLNGAPASAVVDLDLGVPGFKYDITANAKDIPLAPLVNSFTPDRKGQVGGTLSTDTKITGIGSTGGNLQTNLAGHFDIGTTNLNLAVGEIRNPLLKSLVSVVVMIPDLAKNPESAVTSLLGSLVSKPGPGTTGGLSGDLEKSPIQQILLRGTMGAGKVQLQQAFVQSPVFQAQASGTVTLAQILTNSAIEIPVSLTLSQPVAARINMVPENTPTNQAYVKLPDFLTMRGTLGEPKKEINKLALLGAVYQGVSGRGSTAGGQTGNLLQGILGGKSGTTVTTNTAPSGVGGLLQGILGGGAKSTNAPATSPTNAPATNKPPAGNLLDGLFGPKKK